ncbi:MAG TPA: 50S ribosomal protein L15 [Sphaerochaeta sp.]|nr:50S ribosomal protein L15 [Sphaerochaeta sp.]
MGMLKAPKGANKKKTILGRGVAKKGRTSGRGHGGQNSRSGGGTRPGFEGGQMPLYRRVARRGFNNGKFKVVYSVVSLDDISRVFADGDLVTNDTLKEMGLVKGVKAQAKILNNGELTKKVVIDGVKVSASAIETIKAAGGEIK